MSRTSDPTPALLAYADASRAEYAAMISLAGAPDPVASVQDLAIPADDPARSLAIRVYTALTATRGTAAPVLLFLHGGGFVSGGLDTHDVMARSIANASRSIVVSLDYRLAPEHPFPAAVEDVHATLLWLRDHAEALGGDATRLVAIGDSAGANLATVACLVARERSGPAILAQVLLYPITAGAAPSASRRALGQSHFPTDATITEVLRCYVPEGGEARAHPWVAPLNADLRGLPPALIAVAEFDPLKDEGRAYAEKLTAAGVPTELVEHPGVGHGFVQFFKQPENQPQGEAAIRRVGEFLLRRLAIQA